MTSPLLTEVADKVTKRMDELRPAYLEYLELSAYAEQMSGFEPPEIPEGRIVLAPASTVPEAPAAAPAKPKPAAAKLPATRQRPGSAKKPAAKKPAAKAAAPNEGETVAKIKEIVAAHPDGIKIGEIIKEGNLSQSYTYDVVKRMTEAKELEKRNRKIYLHRNARTETPATSQQAAQAVTA